MCFPKGFCVIPHGGLFFVFALRALLGHTDFTDFTDFFFALKRFAYNVTQKTQKAQKVLACGEKGDCYAKIIVRIWK